MPDITDLSANQASGDSGNVSSVLVENLTSVHMSSNPQASSVEIHDGKTMQPNSSLQGAAPSTNKIARKLDSVVANDRHPTCSAGVDMHADYLRTIYKHSYNFQVPRVSNDGETVPVLQALQQEATPLDGEKWLSDLQIDNSISCDDSVRAVTAQPIINKTEESSTWDSLRGVGAWACSPIECGAVQRLDSDPHSFIEPVLCQSPYYPRILEVEEEME